MATPAKQSSEERSRALAPELEVRLAAEDAGASRVVFDAIDLADEVEGVLRLGMFALFEDLAAGVRIIWSSA